MIGGHMHALNTRQERPINGLEANGPFHCIVGLAVGCSTLSAIVSLTCALGMAWLIVYLASDIDSVASHAYYFPIIFAAIRFGSLAALLIAILSGLLAEPLPLLASDAVGLKELSLWVSRIGFFLIIGQIFAWIVRPKSLSVAENARQISFEQEIRVAISRRQFYLVYQPIFSLKTSRLVGVEALVRWRHPSGENVSPVRFVATAERSNLIHELSIYILREACSQACKWHERGQAENIAPWHISVNISGRDLELFDLAERVESILKETGLPPDILQIELTETELAFKGAGEQLKQLRRLGIQIAIDDFGIGYSSLSYLHRFRVDSIKIDRSVISGIGTNASDQALARGIVLLARSMGLNTIAEGLESEEQHRIGKVLQFDYVQGYYYAKPLSAKAISAQMLDEAC